MVEYFVVMFYATLASTLLLAVFYGGNNVKAVYVGDTLITSILGIVHKKCACIGRPSLSDVKAEEVHLLAETPTGCRIVRLRGMRYQVDLVRETFGTFDPVSTSSSVRSRAYPCRAHLAAEG
jgi:hypothetical protein